MERGLLNRDNFRKAVFARDKQTCVFCKNTAVDAHHIIERRLWISGGYYLDNGASVCEEHHIKCETTELSVEDVRKTCGITRILVPDHLYADQIYDKWGNPVLPNGQRLRGDLFFDESVQKILKHGDKLSLFTHWVKYPRTHHLPWSEGIHADDRVIDSLVPFIAKRVVVTEKMDGENTTMYRDHIHARSVDGRHHPSRNWIKKFWSTIAFNIPKGWRICGENLYAKHSIEYKELPSYFMGFSIWNDHNVCLNWKETLEWFELLGITPVPVLYDGDFDPERIGGLWDMKMWNKSEGYVVRLFDDIGYAEFRHKVAKFVRKKHIQTVKHWMHGQPLEKNSLA